MTVPADLPDFRRLRVAVVGDPIADLYLHAQPRRLSREAPVMVLRHLSERLGAGGAANVARNLRALGPSVSLFGAVGRDANGRELARILGAEEIDISCVSHVAEWTTPTKTRVLAALSRRFPQQVLRIDREPARAVPAGARAELAGQLRERADEFDAVVVSDYEYGTVGGEVGAVARELAEGGKLVVLDPRRDLELFRGVTSLTPNVEELARFVDVEPARLDKVGALQEAAERLLGAGLCRWLLVTRGNLGMALFGEGLPEEGVAVEASGSGEVTDVSGAGDTAAAAFALSLAGGFDAPTAMIVANAASGVVVMENGTAVCPWPDLKAALATTPAPVRLGRPSYT
ncbi:MAG: PfkB family carbohydrate kinase [Planctomycetota bacterium]|jgi:rfaE bifunctional protein kinase chain/domain|nr:PfkB family carbohydrate kinase [Planctomycetota bacterium]MDP6761355.1 PfkB family carbohydrate kinase [Planctomycetota bacterium]MDP6989934.1 PfkB family carbohydrate kinase [Planctomycetota bacterium]